MRIGCTLAASVAALMIWNAPFTALIPWLREDKGISMASPLGEKVELAPAAQVWGEIPLTRAKFFRLRIDPQADQPVMELLNDEGDRILRIWIGLNEAIAIEMETKKIVPPRPMTHDLIVNILKGLGVKVKQVIIYDLRNHTFYASILLSMEGEDYAIDSRPSDAIALSLRVSAPIYVARKIFAKYGFKVSENVMADELRELLEADVQNLTPELATSFGLKEAGGVLVADVQPEGKAAEGGLRRGDVILEADGKSIMNLAQLAARLKDWTGKEPLRLKVYRKGKSLDLTVKP